MNKKCTSDTAIRHENSIPERIYTYLPSKYVVPDILLQHLKLCEANNTNDLTEYYFEIVFPESPLKGSLVDRQNRLLAKKEFNERIPEYARMVKFIPFSKTKTNMPIWAHYGDKGRGICLGFQIDLSIDGDKLVHKVEYDKPVSILLLPEQCDKRPPEYWKGIIRRILTTKRPSWSYEEEWRLLVPINCDRLEKELDGKQFFRFLNSEIKEVVFGPRCSAVDIGKVGLACMKTELHVTFYRMERRMIVERKKLEEIDCDGIPGNVGTAYREEYIPCLLSKKKMSRYMDYAILQCGVDPHLLTDS